MVRKRADATEQANLTKDDQTPVGPSAAQFSALLEPFLEVRKRADATEQTNAVEEQRRLSSLLAGYDNSVERYRQLQEEVAEEFNLVERHAVDRQGDSVQYGTCLAP